MKLKMNYREAMEILFCFLIFFVSVIHAQEPINTYKLDEIQLALTQDCSMVNDVLAENGTAIFRPSTANSGTYWFGPYKHFQAGNYLIQFRMKVSSNLSDAGIITLDASSLNFGVLNSFVLKPNMFRNSNEYQIITIPLSLPANIYDLEIRGIGFVSGIADLYLDNIMLIPGDIRGFYSNNFTVDSKGNVSIGTISSQDYKLAVAGTMIAESVKVKLHSAWPDYVFEKNYKLLPLQELEKNINDQGHLPGIPSAVAIKTDGIDLGDMNKKLLQKIEELTLYLIELKKDNDCQRDLNLINQKQIKQLMVEMQKGR